jgi:orotate phosphoribosyltransferase
LDKPLALSLARDLWRIEAVHIRPNPPYRWSSGWLSPVYCDNRKILSHPPMRSRVAAAFAAAVKNRFEQTECLAAVATGAIGHAALAADRLNLPMVYVRPEPKSHGLENRIEGVLPKESKTLVIEDLVSTGSGAMRVIEALQHEGAKTVGVLSLFDYGFPHARQLFSRHGVDFDYLCNFECVVETGIELGKVEPNLRDLLYRWKDHPENWQPSFP